MAYLLFRDHNIIPSQYEKLGRNERVLLRAFVKKECEERKEAYRE